MLHLDFQSTNDFKIGILERRIVAFEYFNIYGEKSERRVEPMQLWFKSKAWYIKAYCLNKQGMRLFKLTRVKNLTLTDETFPVRDLLAEPPPQPNKRENTDITLRMRVAPELTYRVFDEFDEEDIERQSDGSFIVTTTWPEDNWVYGYVLSYGEYGEVLEPEHLREIIKTKTHKMLGKYL